MIGTLPRHPKIQTVATTPEITNTSTEIANTSTETPNA
jgi:hypothetical protein